MTCKCGYDAIGDWMWTIVVIVFMFFAIYFIGTNRARIERLERASQAQEHPEAPK